MSKETKDMENVKQFHANDMVYRYDKKKKRIIFGVVTDSYDSENASDLSDNPLQKGEIRVLWSNQIEEQIWNYNKVQLLSRSVMPGDIVRRFKKGIETQRGICKEIEKTATVRIIGTDKIIDGVSGNRLHRVSQFDIDDAVCLGDKYGRIENIDQRIMMASKCGSMVELLTSINHEIEDFWSMNKTKGLYEPFYPGQEVVCVPKDLEQPLWIKKSKSIRRNPRIRRRFTIQTVEDCMMEVAWFATGESAKNDAKTCEMTVEEIKNLKIVQHESEYLDTRQMLKINSSDTLLNKKDWMKRLTSMYKRENKIKLKCICNMCSLKRNAKNPTENDDVSDGWLTVDEEANDEEEDELDAVSQTAQTGWKMEHYPPNVEDLTPGNTLPVEIICVEVVATVVWQDGNVEQNIPTINLVYSVSLDDHEFFPGDWVIQSDKDIVENENSYSYGVVQHVNYLERTATVKWFKYKDDKQTEMSTNENSVYDLKKHSTFLFRPSSVVCAKPIQVAKLGSVIESSPKGYVTVKWVDETVENCLPDNLEIIPESSEYELSDDDDSEIREPISWETESIESYAGDSTDVSTLQNMASRLEFIRTRIIYFKEAFKTHTFQENLNFLKDLLTVYENSSYLDKLLGTSYFSLKSKHFQLILAQAKERAKAAGVEFRGRLFTNETPYPPLVKFKVAEKDNINKVLKLENKVHAQIENNKEKRNVDSENNSPETSELSQENLCIELLSMIKHRMDLAYAELVSKIGGPQALTIMTQASENVAFYSSAVATPLPNLPTTPDDSACSLNPPKFDVCPAVSENRTFSFMEDAPVTHHYYDGKFEPTDVQRFMKALQREYALLSETLPGIWVRAYSDRIDLLSVMIEGPSNTPYEDGLFLFDVQLSVDYPRSPPLVHYVSYSTESLNPNLYVEGKVCVSLLGTWMGRGTETWGTDSTLLQLFISIQGLILVSEPYYNEAGYEKQTHTQQGRENSRTYNEHVILKLVQSMTELLQSPPQIFKKEIFDHFSRKGAKLCERLRLFCEMSDPLKPDFPLLPVSKGLKLSLATALQHFEVVSKNVLNRNHILPN